MIGDRVYLVAQAKAAQDFQAAEAQIAGLRIDEDLASLFDQQRTNAVLGKQRRRGQAAGAGAGNENRYPKGGSHYKMIALSQIKD